MSRGFNFRSESFGVGWHSVRGFNFKAAAGPVADYTVATGAEWDAVFSNADAELSGKTIAIKGVIPDKTLSSRTFPVGPTLFCTGAGSMDRLHLESTANIDLNGMAFRQDSLTDNDGGSAYDLLYCSGTTSGVILRNSLFDGAPSAANGAQQTEAQMNKRMSCIGNANGTTGALVVDNCEFYRMYDGVVWNNAPLKITNSHFEQVYIDAITGLVNDLAGTGTGWEITDNSYTIFEGINKRRYTVSSITGTPTAGDTFTSGSKVLLVESYDAGNAYVVAAYNNYDIPVVSDVFTASGKSFTIDAIASPSIVDGLHGDVCQPIRNSGSGDVPFIFKRNHVYRSKPFETSSFGQEQNVQGLLAQTNGGTIRFSPVEVNANMIAGGQNVGLKIDNASDGSIMNNQVLWQERMGAGRSRIELSNIAGDVVVTKNVGDKTASESVWYLDGGGNNFVDSGNLYLDGDDGSQEAAMTAPTSYPQTLVNLAPVPGQAIDNADAGPLTTGAEFRTIIVPELVPSIVEAAPSYAEGESAPLGYGTFTAGAGSNRKVISFVGTFDADNNEMDLGATWGGVAGERILQQASGTGPGNDFEYIAVFQWQESDFPAGATGTLSFTEAGASVDDIAGTAFTVRGCDQVAAASVVSAAQAAASVDITPTEAGSLVIGFCNASFSDLAIDWTAPITSFGTSVNYAASNTSSMCLGIAGNRPASTVTVEHDAATGRPIAAAISLAPA